MPKITENDKIYQKCFEKHNHINIWFIFSFFLQFYYIARLKDTDCPILTKNHILWKLESNSRTNLMVKLCKSQIFENVVSQRLWPFLEYLYGRSVCQAEGTPSGTPIYNWPPFHLTLACRRGGWAWQILSFLREKYYILFYKILKNEAKWGVAGKPGRGGCARDQLWRWVCNLHTWLHLNYDHFSELESDSRISRPDISSKIWASYLRLRLPPLHIRCESKTNVSCLKLPSEVPSFVKFHWSVYQTNSKSTWCQNGCMALWNYSGRTF